MRLAIPVGNYHGWGILGGNLTHELNLLPPISDEMSLHAITGPNFNVLFPAQWNRKNVGLCFIEDINEAALHVDRAMRFDKILAGSTWCADALRKVGIEAGVFIQGVDHEWFYPRLERTVAFTVFSGGKLEYRKGQDIVIAAMAEFMKEYPDVVLSCAWENQWPATMDTMAHSKFIKYIKGGTCRETIRATLEANGIPMDRVVLWPLLAHPYLAAAYQESNVGLFLSRVEAGTNLVLMEYAACGRPVIARGCDHGHDDILRKLFSSNRILPHQLAKPEAVIEALREEYKVWKEKAFSYDGPNARAMKRFTWAACAEQVHKACLDVA